MGKEPQPPRTITYCIVPWELAPKLHEPLRRHFLSDAQTVEVVVEHRDDERRGPEPRRQAQGTPPARERRRLRNVEGRRIAERRAALIAVDPPPGLPRRALAHLDRLIFVERLEPASDHVEDLDSARLVARFQRGEADAFRQLYIRYFDRVYRYLLVVMSTPDAAEDVTQQTFLQALDGLARYEQRSTPFRAWLFVIARNCAISQLRKSARIELADPVELGAHRDREPAIDPVDSDMSALDWITDDELLLFIERLPLAQRQVLLLRYTLDMAYPEIGRILDRTPDDVRMLHHRAMTFLRERLGAVRARSGQSHGQPQSMVRVRAQSFLLRRRRFALMR